MCRRFQLSYKSENASRVNKVFLDNLCVEACLIEFLGFNGNGLKPKAERR